MNIPVIKSILIVMSFVFISGAFAQPGGEIPELRLPTERALKALKSNFRVTVSETDLYFAFDSTWIRKNTGVIFHPGGAVDPRAYAPLARKIALRGYRVLILKTPSELVVAGVLPSMVNTVININGDIDNWALAGHSVGGVAAAQFIFDNPEAQSVKGLALLAAFPNPEKPISDRDDLSIISISGSNDCIVTEETINTFKWALPITTSYFEIGGANHAQFGDYGPQEGDCDADISISEQQFKTKKAMIHFLLKEIK